ncbi:hypothetical protein I7I48_07139 [Histoplasma ohiense]|nr:hypothetical protein I7I48_07139 [Histoplasma ohiense (nom. inval.)]
MKRERGSGFPPILHGFQSAIITNSKCRFHAYYSVVYLSTLDRASMQRFGVLHAVGDLHVHTPYSVQSSCSRMYAVCRESRRPTGLFSLSSETSRVASC